MRISDWSSDVCSSDLAAQKAEISFFMLGGSEEENAAACAAVRHLYPRLKIAGRHHGYFAETASAGVCRSIIASGAEVLWVALGKPRQEFWSIDNRERLRGVSWIKTCGGRSEEHTSELQSLMRISYAVFCLKKKTEPKQLIRIYNYVFHFKRKKQQN